MSKLNSQLNLYNVKSEFSKLKQVISMTHISMWKYIER